MDKKIDEFFEKNNFHVKVNNYQIYKEALTHMTFANENNLDYNYQRLEYLGDAILEFLSSEYIYRLYPNLNEGEMTIIRSNAVKGDQLAVFSKNLGIIDMMLFGKGNDDFNENPKMMADSFESFVAALFLDQGIDEVRRFLRTNVFDFIKKSRGKEEKNPKTVLQELLQTESRAAIVYETKEHGDGYEAHIFHEGNHFGVGRGTTKKEAEVNAAKDALEKVGG